MTWFLFTVTLTVDVRVENKENQWMGVTVQSQGPGGKIVVRQLMDQLQCHHFDNFHLLFVSHNV